MAKPEVGQLASVNRPTHVLQQTAELADAMKCMTEKGDVAQCTDKFDDMKKLGGYKEEEVVAFTQKVKNTAYKAGAVKTVGTVALVGMSVAGFTPFGARLAFN